MTSPDAKIRRPAPNGLERPRLSAVLHEPGGPGVVTVIAPPGSGKTTMLALASAHAPGVAWYTAGPEDRRPGTFLGGIARALSPAVARDLGRPDTSTALADELSSCGTEPVLLVVDDAHEVAGGPAAEGDLADLLRLRPTWLRVALGTRRPLTVDTPRLLVSGELVEIDADALRFRSWEVEQLFRLVYRQPLSPEAAAALTRRTGGWAAGLKLFQLATTGKSRAEQERAVGELGGRSRLLRSYLTRTVLDELDDDTRDFLLATSTLGTLTGSLCDALLGRSGSARVLEDLVSRQFFTAAAEDGTSYRYHQVMQTLLEGLLIEERGPERARETYARSARLLEDAALFGDAARAYLLADDLSSVGRLVQRYDGALVLPDPDADGVPQDDPWLLLAAARRHYRRGAVAQAVATFRRAEPLIDDPDLHRRCAMERARAAAWLPGASPASTGRGRVATVDEVLRSATVRLAPTPPPPERTALVRGLCHLLAGRLDEARWVLDAAPRRTPGEGLAADLALVVADLATADKGDTLTRLEELEVSADREGQPWLARMTRGLRSAVLLGTGGEDWQAESGASLAEECRRDGDEWGATLLEGALGAALLVRDDERGEGWLARAAEDARRLDAEVLVTWAEGLAAAAAVRAGRPRSAERLAAVLAAARHCGVHDLRSVLQRLLPTAVTAPPRRRPAVVAVRCLGPFSLERGGVPLPLPELRPLPRSLLLILAMHRGAEVHREVLAGWLWPEAPPDAAGHRLHVAASTVRRALTEAGLGCAELQRRGSAYRLAVADAVFDVGEVETAARQATLAEARGDLEGALTWGQEVLRWYVADLLPEAGPSEWVVAERERLRLTAARAAYDLGSVALRLGRSGDALAAATRAVDLDPLRDSAWALLAQVQRSMGDHSAAMATRRAHEEVARDVLDSGAPGARPTPA